jgi:hypothetical protein
MRSIRALAVAGILAVVMAACSGGGNDNATELPSGLPSALPSGLPTALPSGLPTALPSGLPTALPSGVPTGLPGGGLKTGTAHIEISGSQSATFDLPLQNGAYAPNVAIGLAYQDSSKNTFAIAGVAFTGTAKTSSTLTVSIVGVSPIILATSASGECSLTLTDASSTHVKGTVSCENLSGGLNVTGSYEATS